MRKIKKLEKLKNSKYFPYLDMIVLKLLQNTDGKKLEKYKK